MGKAVALVSDAGMPLISDPGSRMVRAVREAGHFITSIPGPTAVTTGLALSGWGQEGFIFAGFPPNKSAGRRRLLEEFKEEPWTIVLYESTHRIVKLLTDLQEILGEREVFMGRELTKKFETLQSGTAVELLEFLETHSSKGEFVVVISPLEKEGVKEKKNKYPKE
jgi:16S rRNA (cytidine1402-2'-O)-methyltransferase